jgi:thiamine kinase-like enzyme
VILGDNGRKKGSMGNDSTLNTDSSCFLSGSFVRDFFETHLHKLNLSDCRILNCEVNRLRSKRRKPAIEFDLSIQNKEEFISKKFIGKWSSDDRGDEVFDLLDEIWQKRYMENDNLKICEPIAYFPDYNFMLTTKARGLELGKVLKQDDVSLLEIYVRQAAKWLAKLHSIHVILGDTYNMQVEEEKLKKWYKHLSWLYPDFTEKIQNMLYCVLDKETSLNPEYFTLIHGDFNPNNIFVEGNDITVIDFEDSCIFDPAKDLGYFVAKLLSAKRKYHLSLDVDSLEKIFLCTYSKELSISKISIDPLRRVNLYKARSYLKHLHSRYWTGRNSRDPDPVDCKFWLDRVEECLQNYQ